MQQGYRQQPPQGRRDVPATRQNSALTLAGASSDPREVTTLLARASEHAHLVTPTTAVAMLPEGCSVVLSTVLVDIERETYDVGAGKRGLAKVALDRIAAGAGISWDPRLSGRIDDGSDPYYCAWRSVGTLRHLDGTEITIDGSKEMDMREGSPQVEGLYAKARPGKSPENQIREMRLHIMAHAESKARLRAVRSIGIRTSYEREELTKPFVVARLMFTGASDDPEIRREFARMTAASMLGGRRALYGEVGSTPSAPTTVHAAVPRQASAPRLAPPPVGSAREEEDDIPFGGPAREPLREQGTPQQQPVRSDAPTSNGGDEERSRSGVTIPGGDERGVAIEDASDRTLEYWEARISKAVADGTSRYPDKDREVARAMRDEIAARAEGGR